MNGADWKRSLETFEIAFLEYAPGARRNIIQLFPQVPDKQKAWEDLVALTAKMVINEDYRVARCMPLIFSSAFPLVPDKEKAWLEITRLVDFKDSQVDRKIKNSMFSIFSNSLKKEEAWADLLQLTGNSNKNNLRTATNILCSYAVRSEDQQKAWDVLIKLTNSEETEVKRIAVGNLNDIFPSVDNKHKAWEDLIKLIDKKDIQVKRTVSNVVASNFSLAPDKQKAWEDLIKIISGDYQVRKVAAGALKSAISMVNNKEKAWEDLLELTAHKDIDVRNHASSALVSAFNLLPDKQKLSQDLYKCMRNKDRNVKATVTSILSFVYSQLPDQQQIWEELIELTNDEDIGVRRNAYYSLGKISIFKASQAENEIVYRKEFEQAIVFFEKTSKESTIFNPSQFCLPFYRSFYAIISDERQRVINEVDKYLTEARAAIKNSKNKQMLLEAVDNLAKALKEVQSLENKTLESKKDELCLYMRYCEQAADLMSETEQMSPYATEVLRKGLPILDRKLKLLLKEIQEKAKTACQESKDTDTEEIACAVSREVQKWDIGNQEEMTQKVEDVAYILKTKVSDLPENEYVLNKIEAMRHERDLTKQFDALLFVIAQIPTIKVVPEDLVIENINKVGQDLGTKLDNISQEMNKIKISLKPGIKEEFEISSGIEIWGTGAKHIVTIPLQEISYSELKEDLERIKGKHISKLSRLPDRLARKIKGYLLINDREDLVEQLT